MTQISSSNQIDGALSSSRLLMAARYRDPENDRGNLTPSLEPGEVLVEYAAPIVDQFPVYPYSREQILELHRQRNASRVAPPVRIAPFIRRSLRRFS
jgi:hypothetical protein